MISAIFNGQTSVFFRNQSVPLLLTCFIAVMVLLPRESTAQSQAEENSPSQSPKYISFLDLLPQALESDDGLKAALGEGARGECLKIWPLPQS